MSETAERQERRWIDTPEVAKLVRKALKAEFPGTKFSVRSSRYSGGSSIHVGWTDGPKTEAVNAVCSRYEGASFDGMIDLKSYHDSMLTTENGAEVVHFGADYVIPQRSESGEAMEHFTAEVERYIEKWGVEPKVTNSLSGREYILYPISSCDGFYVVGQEEKTEGPALASDEHGRGWSIQELAFQLWAMSDLRAGMPAVK